MKDSKGAGLHDDVQKFVLVVIWVIYAERFWDLRTAKRPLILLQPLYSSVCSQAATRTLNGRGFPPLVDASPSLSGFIT